MKKGYFLTSDQKPRQIKAQAIGETADGFKVWHEITEAGEELDTDLMLTYHNINGERFAIYTEL